MNYLFFDKKDNSHDVTRSKMYLMLLLMEILNSDMFYQKNLAKNYT